MPERNHETVPQSGVIARTMDQPATAPSPMGNSHLVPDEATSAHDEDSLPHLRRACIAMLRNFALEAEDDDAIDHVLETAEDRCLNSKSFLAEEKGYTSLFLREFLRVWVHEHDLEDVSDTLERHSVTDQRQEQLFEPVKRQLNPRSVATELGATLAHRFDPRNWSFPALSDTSEKQLQMTFVVSAMLMQEKAFKADGRSLQDVANQVAETTVVGFD